MDRDDFLDYLTQTPTRRRSLARRSVLGVCPGEPGSHAHWNAQRLRRLVRTLPPGSTFRRTLEAKLSVEEERIAEATAHPRVATARPRARSWKL